jgi:NitT/TauT family transport system ATP-binding protein
MPANIAVDLHQVSYVYSNGLRALTPIDLRIDRGEFVSILGPSGCGKSTILRLVAGLLTPPQDAQPEARIDVWPDSPAEDNPLACVFQSPTLMPWANVERNVRLPLELSNKQDTQDIDARIEHALQMVGLQDFRAAYPRELSGGMQMRASIARALITQPSLLLMDEPFAALDEITRGRLDADLLSLWKKEALTVLFVTHSIYEAVFLSTRIIVMSARPGRIIGELIIDEPSNATNEATNNVTKPRNDAFRSSEKFARYCAEASRLLHAGMSEKSIA